MTPMYEVRFKEPNGVLSFTRYWSGPEMVAALNEKVKLGWIILSCEIVPEN